MRRWTVQWALLAVAVVGVIPRTGRAADEGPLTQYLTDDVFAVASVDLTKLDLLAGFEEFARLGVVPQEFLDAERQKATLAQQLYAELPKQGARRAYGLLRASDLQSGGTTWVIETTDAAAAKRVLDLLDPWLKKAHSERSFDDETAFVPHVLDVAGNVVLAACSDEQMKMLKASHAATPRAEAVAALGVLSKADGGIVAFGDPDSRRVVREMFPAAPAPFMEIDGRLLADGVAWGGVLLKLPPGPTVTVTLEAASPAALATFEGAFEKGLELLKALCVVEAASGPPAHKARALALLPVVPHLKPTVDGNRLTLTLLDDQAEIDALHSMAPPAAGSAREAASRARRMNNFKQIALAMFMYHDKHGSFPPAASYDANGRPLLSWRVQLLPYLDQQALYDEFRLDEPWDSDHNRKLVERMPAWFAEPDAATQRAVGGAGRTRVLAPTGKGLVFDGRDGTKLLSIKDGTSNTILVVEAIPERAVEWTKPADWEVDLANPLQGVKPGDGGVFAAAFCDGSVRTINGAVEPKEFAAQLTPAAGD
jgi:hypothetical protein